MNRLRSFSTVNPTGDTPGMEPVRLDVLRAAVENVAPTPLKEVPATPPVAIAPAPVVPAPQPPLPPLINKNIRLPADLVEFIDYEYTKDKRMKKQDAYTEALEAFFRPLMAQRGSSK